MLPSVRFNWKKHDCAVGLVMDREQIEVFARGLYHLANVDGIDDSEMAIISEFLTEHNAEEVMESLPSATFDLNQAFDVFETAFLRRVFLKASIVMVRADGVLSDEERTAIAEVADAFGQADLLGELEAEVADVTSFD